MSKSNALENGLLKLIYQAVAFASIADNTATSPLTYIYVALHTGDPGEGGDQTTNEANYTGYARVAVVRSAVGWTVTDNQVVNAGAVTFGACTAGSSTVTHFSTGYLASGAGAILHKGAISSPAAGLAVTAGVTPSFAAGALTITED